MLKLFGLGGDGKSAPAETQIAYWAALAAGADGLLLQVRRAGSGELRCVPASVSEPPGGLDYNNFDAGHGSPWAARDTTRPALHHPRLQDVLQVFGRRASIALQTSDPSVGPQLSALLDAFGLLSQTPVIAPRAVFVEARRLHWIAQVDSPALADAEIAGAQGLALSPSSALQLSAAAKYGLPLWLLQSDIDNLSKLDTAGIAVTAASSNILALVDTLRPQYVVFQDTLQSDRLDRESWAAGYSHSNSETSLEPRPEGFAIGFERGSEYSGGGLVTRASVYGAFDARVSFVASKLQQACTFELAAIGLDPGYTELDARKLTGDNVHLTFDVHGAPPYASSECDENDGFRFGWNNSSNLTRISPDWVHDSAKMYNKYGRDVGPGPERGVAYEGSLRLRRTGSIFASYFRDQQSLEWVCSGAGPVAALPADAFIRVAAKHWRKTGEPPAAQITFSRFELRQP